MAVQRWLGKSEARALVVFPVRLADWCAPLIAVLLQLQVTLSLASTDVRLNAADLMLALGVPLLFAGTVRNFPVMLRYIGGRLLIVFVLVTIVMTVALFNGFAEIGHFTGWSIVKYVGWYVLLAYFVIGMLLLLNGHRETLHRFVYAFITFQVIVVAIFVFGELVTISTPFHYGPRLIGLAGNPNAMGLYLLCGLSLCLSFLHGVAERRWTAGCLFVGAAVLLAGVLYTKSVAALIALVALCAARMLLSPGTWKRLICVVLVGGGIWGVPQAVNPLHGITTSIFGKLVILVTVDNEIGKNTLPHAPGTLSRNSAEGATPQQRSAEQRSERRIERWLTLDARLDSYRRALEEWRPNPLFGTGFGVHLYNQRGSDESKPQVQIHSTPIWLLVETGLLGLFAVAVLYMLIFIHINSIAHQSSESDPTGRAFAQGALLMLIAWAVMALFHELLYQRCLWLLMGMAMATVRWLDEGSSQV